MDAERVLEGKNAIVTGASRGLGEAIARKFWAAGANLLLVARSRSALFDLQGELSNTSMEGQLARIMVANLQAPFAPADTMAFARDVWPQLDILVNNAALTGPIGPVAELDWTLWQRSFLVNLFAPTELSARAVLWMRETGTSGSIVNVSGGGASSPRKFFSAYGSAKCALVRFSETLAEEVRGSGIRVNCIAPGVMNTSMQQEIANAGPDATGVGEHELALRTLAEGGVSNAMNAARLALYLASEKSAEITGKLISAMWDPWMHLHDYGKALKKSDVYTLRRIVPQHVEKVWKRD